MTFTDSAFRYCVWSTASTWMQTAYCFPPVAGKACADSMKMSTNQSLQDFTTVFCAFKYFYTKVCVVVNDLKQKSWPDKTEIPGKTNSLSYSHNGCLHTVDKNKDDLTLHVWNLLHFLSSHDSIHHRMSMHESRPGCVPNALLGCWNNPSRHQVFNMCSVTVQ